MQVKVNLYQIMQMALPLEHIYVNILFNAMQVLHQAISVIRYNQIQLQFLQNAILIVLQFV